MSDFDIGRYSGYAPSTHPYERHPMSLNVSLTPELEEYISSKVQSGNYTSASEVVREGLRLLQASEGSKVEWAVNARAKIERGWQQAQSGQLVDGATATGRIKDRMEVTIKTRSTKRA